MSTPYTHSNSFSAAAAGATASSERSSAASEHRASHHYDRSKLAAANVQNSSNKTLSSELIRSRRTNRTFQADWSNRAHAVLFGQGCTSTIGASLHHSSSRNHAPYHGTPSDNNSHHHQQPIDASRSNSDALVFLRRRRDALMSRGAAITVAAATDTTNAMPIPAVEPGVQRSSPPRTDPLHQPQEDVAPLHASTYPPTPSSSGVIISGNECLEEEEAIGDDIQVSRSVSAASSRSRPHRYSIGTTTDLPIDPTYAQYQDASTHTTNTIPSSPPSPSPPASTHHRQDSGTSPSVVVLASKRRVSLQDLAGEEPSPLAAGSGASRCMEDGGASPINVSGTTKIGNHYHTNSNTHSDLPDAVDHHLLISQVATASPGPSHRTSPASSPMKRRRSTTPPLTWSSPSSNDDGDGSDDSKHHYHSSHHQPLRGATNYNQRDTSFMSDEEIDAILETTTVSEYTPSEAREIVGMDGERWRGLGSTVKKKGENTAPNGQPRRIIIKRSIDKNGMMPLLEGHQHRDRYLPPPSSVRGGGREYAHLSSSAGPSGRYTTQTPSSSTTVSSSPMFQNSSQEATPSRRGNGHNTSLTRTPNRSMSQSSRVHIAATSAARRALPPPPAVADQCISIASFPLVRTSSQHKH